MIWTALILRSSWMLDRSWHLPSDLVALQWPPSMETKLAFSQSMLAYGGAWEASASVVFISCCEGESSRGCLWNYQFRVMKRRKRVIGTTDRVDVLELGIRELGLGYCVLETVALIAIDTFVELRDESWI